MDVICFSKDRPMQLHAYLESMHHYSDISLHRVTVIYVETERIPYDGVRKRFPEVCWVPQGSFFDDLQTAIGKCGEWVLFGCDDVIFTRHFSIERCCRILERDPEVFGFSLRLGLNVRGAPVFCTHEGAIVWDWKLAQSRHWNYPWEVSSSIYRSEFVKQYVEGNLNIKNPNRFEAFLAGAISDGDAEVSPKMACFVKGCCVSLVVNRVQDEYPNGFDDRKNLSPEFLCDTYGSGVCIDWIVNEELNYRDLHVGSEFFRLSTLEIGQISGCRHFFVRSSRVLRGLIEAMLLLFRNRVRRLW